MSVLSEYTRILLQRTRDSILYSTNLAQPVNDDDDDDDDEDNDPASMFFSVPGVSVHRVQESIPLTDSLALRDGGIRHGGGGALQDVNEADYDEYVDEDGQRNVNGYSVGNIGYSDYSYSSRVSEMPSDMEELPTPSAIYLDVPPPVPSSYPNKHSLSESLLPTAAAIPSGITTVRPKRKFRDPIFALLYALTMVTFLITGIVLLCITTSTSLETASRKTVFDTIRNSAGMLAGMILFSMAVGALWILVLRTFAKYIVWGTIVAVPAIMFGMFIWTLAESFHGGTLHGGMNSQDIVLAALSLLPLMIGVLSIGLTSRRKERVNKTVSVIEFACDILKDNPEMFLISLGLMVAFIIFSSIWLVIFSRLWLLGNVKSNDEGEWVVDGNIWPLVVFFILVYLWTAAVLRNIQRFILAGVTAQWYFHRHELTGPQAENPTRAALSRATSTSFGTLCFGGLILSTAQLLQLAMRYARKNMKSSNASPFVYFFSACIQCLEGIIDQVNNYTIIFAGITGEDFCSAARSATKTFRRNLVSGLLTDVITKMVIYVGSLIISLISGFGTYIYAAHSLDSPYGYVVGIVATVVPLYVSQFYTYIMMNIVDAAFMCYAIDLDHNTVHANRAHDAFAGVVGQ